MNTGPNNQPAYDYAIVGSGAGGGPLAGNLAKAGQKVLLLEAGSDYEDYNYQVPAFHALATEDENLCWDHFVRHYTNDKQQRCDTKFTPERNGVLYPRCMAFPISLEVFWQSESTRFRWLALYQCCRPSCGHQ